MHEARLGEFWADSQVWGTSIEQSRDARTYSSRPNLDMQICHFGIFVELHS